MSKLLAERGFPSIPTEVCEVAALVELISDPEGPGTLFVADGTGFVTVRTALVGAFMGQEAVSTVEFVLARVGINGIGQM